MLNKHIIKELLDYVKYSQGYFEGYEEDVWVGDEYSHEWNRLFWDEIKDVLTVLVSNYGRVEFRYFEKDDWFRLEHVDCGFVNPLMFENVRMTNEELENVCEKINKWESQSFPLDMEDFKFIGSGYFSMVYKVNDNLIWKKYTNHDVESYDNLYKDADILLDLEGIKIFPKVYAYIPDKGLLVEYIEGKKFELSEFHRNDIKIIIEKLMIGFKESYERGYIFRDVKEDNVIITDKLNPIMVDVGYFEDVDCYVDTYEQWCFDYITDDLLEEIEQLANLYDL